MVYILAMESAVAAPPLKPKRQGNYKPGPGRPPGSKNKKTLAMEAALREAIATAGVDLPGAFNGDAHAFLTWVYRHPGLPLDLRILAAGKALRVEKPALAATAVGGRIEVMHGFAERLEAARRRVGMTNGLIER